MKERTKMNKIGMEIIINKEIIDEMNLVIDNFVDLYKNKVVHVQTLLVCLQALCDKQKELSDNL